MDDSQLALRGQFLAHAFYDELEEIQKTAAPVGAFGNFFKAMGQTGKRLKDAGRTGFNRSTQYRKAGGDWGPSTSPDLVPDSPAGLSMRQRRALNPKNRAGKTPEELAELDNLLNIQGLQRRVRYDAKPDAGLADFAKLYGGRALEGMSRNPGATTAGAVGLGALGTYGVLT